MPMCDWSSDVCSSDLTFRNRVILKTQLKLTPWPQTSAVSFQACVCSRGPSSRPVLLEAQSSLAFSTASLMGSVHTHTSKILFPLVTSKGTRSHRVLVLHQSDTDYPGIIAFLCGGLFSCSPALNSPGREGRDEHSCLENPRGRGAWWATVHGGRKESDTRQ